MLIICEGLDRVGKTTISKYYESLGFHVVHMRAPDKSYTPDSFFQEMIDLVSQAASQNIFLDRSYYGEAFIWPQVFGRDALISEHDIDIIREVEESVGVKRILMYDSDMEAHWKRCIENNEPITKPQFTKARSLYSQMSHRYGFEMVTLPKFVKQFPEAEQFVSEQEPTKQNIIESKQLSTNNNDAKVTINDNSKTPEQLKLEKANVINEVLSKRILKLKGPVYDELEVDLRDFLNTKLSKLLGGASKEPSLTPEEIKFYKAMYIRALSK